MLKQRIYRHFLLENEEQKLPFSSRFYIQKISLTTYLSYLDYLLIYRLYFFMCCSNPLQYDSTGPGEVSISNCNGTPPPGVAICVYCNYSRTSSTTDSLLKKERKTICKCT